jgi:glutaminyl-tRNA synthetase
MSSNTPTSPPSNPSKNNAAAPAADGEHKVSNFLRQIIENDLDKGTYSQRRWAGTPGDAAHHAAGQPTRPRSAPASRPSPTATCTWATPRASA